MGELLYCIKDLFRDNLPRVVVLCAVLLLGTVFGVRSGLGSGTVACVTDSSALVCLYIGGRINVFSFVLLTMLTGVLAFGIIIVVSGHRYTYWLGVVVLFYNVFGIAQRTVMLISVFRLAAVPFVLICHVPLRLCFTGLLLIAWLIAAPAPELRYCRGFSVQAILRNGERALFVTVGLAVVATAEGILTFLLTFGIVI